MNSHNNKLEFTRNISNNIDRVLLFHELESRKFEREEWENQYHKTNPYRTEMNVTLVLDVFISTGAPELIPFFSPARHCVSFNMVIVLYVLQAFLF
jgi:hypothetical protein